MESGGTPPSIERILHRFRRMGRDEKMQALVQYAKQLEPLPSQYATIDRSNYTVPECQTRVDLFPEVHDGVMHFYADLNVRQSPTIAAVLVILFTAINGHPPQVTLAIPADFVRTLMEGVGLHTREVGLNAIIARLKRCAAKAMVETQQGQQGVPPS